MQLYFWWGFWLLTGHPNMTTWQTTWDILHGPILRQMFVRLISIYIPWLFVIMNNEQAKWFSIFLLEKNWKLKIEKDIITLKWASQKLNKCGCFHLYVYFICVYIILTTFIEYIFNLDVRQIRNLCHLIQIACVDDD